MPGARLADLNSVISCVLCGGYLVNATTLVECLHSFCRVCIVRYLDTSNLCPICDVPVHKTKPLNYIRTDNTLQDIVYKVVPGLYQREMKKRRDFYEKHPGPDPGVKCHEDRGVVDDASRLIFSPDDTISVSLEYSTGKQEKNSGEKSGEATDSGSQTEPQGAPAVQRRFLSCPAAFTVSHLQKFIRMKYSLEARYQVDILYMDDILYQDYSLMDIAYIYTWKRDCPLRLFFRIYRLPPKPALVKTVPAETSAVVQQTVSGEANSSEQKEPTKQPEACQANLSESAEENHAPAPVPPAPEQVDKPVAKPSPEPAAPVPTSVPQPEEPTEAVATVVPAAEPHSVETPEMKTAVEEESTAPGSPKAIALVQSTPPQRQKASEPPAEAQSPPPLPKITISTLDKNSHKILIHTKDVPPSLGQALSPPQNGQDRSPPSGKKSKRKEQRDVDRHQSKRKSPEKPEKRTQWSRSPVEDSSPNKKLKLDGCDDAVEVDTACRKPASSPLQRSDGASLPEAAKHNMPKTVPSPRKPQPPPPPAHPRTPPCAPLPPPNLLRSEEDTRPLDLSVSHRGGAPPQEPPRRPRGRPPIPLPTVPMPLPLVTKRPSPPPPTYSTPTAMPHFHKLPATPPTSSSSHHHHHHHRGNSKSFLKGANLTCINPDPNAFHTRIVIKNVPPRNSTNNSAHRV